MQFLRIIATADGSSSILNTRLNETYHSMHGAIQESQHVFIDRGLAFVSQEKGYSAISVLEIGFGTGLNALLSLQYATHHKKKIYYETIEAYPIDKSVWVELNYPSKTRDQNNFEKLHQALWNHPVEITSDFVLLKREGHLQEAAFDMSRFDVVFLMPLRQQHNLNYGKKKCCEKWWTP